MKTETQIGYNSELAEIVERLDLSIDYSGLSVSISASGCGELGTIDEAGFEWANNVDSKILKLSDLSGLGDMVVEDMLNRAFELLEQDFTQDLSDMGTHSLSSRAYD